MKNKSKGLVLLMVFAIALVGCKKDSDDEDRSNSINFNGKDYALSSGYLEYYGKVTGMESYNMDLTVISSGIKVHEEDGNVDSVSGMGNVMYFEIFTSDSGFLDSRTYTFDPEETYEVGTFDWGVIGLNLNLLTLEGEYFTVESGTITIKKSGETYEVSVNCKDATGKTITGYFKGSLKYFDYGNMDLKKASRHGSVFNKEKHIR